MIRRRFLLEGLACDCRIGAYDHERLAPQRVVIDAEIELSGAGEPTSDRLEDTLNYDLIRGSILEIAARRSASWEDARREVSPWTYDGRSLLPFFLRRFLADGAPASIGAMPI